MQKYNVVYVTKQRKHQTNYKQSAESRPIPEKLPDEKPELSSLSTDGPTSTQRRTGSHVLL